MEIRNITQDSTEILSFVAFIQTTENQNVCYTTSDSEIYYRGTKAKNCLDFKEIKNALATTVRSEITITTIETPNINLLNASIDIVAIGNKESPGEITIINGTIVSHTTRQHGHELIIKPIYHKLEQRIGEFFSEFCRAELGDSKCKVDLSKYTHTGQITQIINQRTIVGNHTVPNGHFFINGTISLKQSQQTFKTRIVDQSGNTVHLLNTPFTNLKIGDPFTIITGCNKRFTTCRDKFNNIASFRGEPFLNGKTLKSVTKPINNTQSDQKK